MTLISCRPAARPVPTIAPLAFGASLSSYLLSTPDRIASEIDIAGAATLTGQDVEATAASFCRSSFDPDVVTTFFTERVPKRSIALLGPMDRLGEYSSKYCTPPATQIETNNYTGAVFSYLLTQPLQGLPVTPLVTAPPSVSEPICSTLAGNSTGVDLALRGLLELATNGKEDGGLFLTLAVDVANVTCSRWAPLARNALVIFLHRSQPGG